MTDTELLIRECLTSYADDAELADLVGAAKAQGRQLSRRRESRYDAWRTVPKPRRMRLVLAGSCVGVVALVAAAFALGGTQHGSNNAVHSSAVNHAAGLPLAVQPQAAALGRAPRALPKRGPLQSAGGSGTGGAVYGRADSSISGTTASPSVGSGAASTAGGDGLTATRVVKTGDLAVTVPRGQVQPTVSKLVALTTSLGGYVSQSRTDNVTGAPEGDVTLRMPVGKFETAVSGAEKLGRETSLTTDAHDVTGKFVDLDARLTALQQTRSTYLTILGTATTIGSTLAVQDRIDGVQSQIEQLQGQLKVLRNQSADGTLTVDVSQVGARLTVRNHPSNGIGKAWHNSTHRFSRGIDAIVGGLGPALLVVLVLAFLAILAWLGVLAVRRAT